ncbi:MAG: DUF2156 domain-containing protein [Candidatus Saccharicenans sp.]
MIPEYPQMKPVRLEDREEVLRLLELYQPEICELTFANIYIWRHWEIPQFTMINGNLCILCSPPDEPPYFLEPVGQKRMEQTVEVCLAAAGRLSRVSEGFLKRLKPSYPYHIREDRDNFDYVYLTSELAELKGKKYDGKRNLIKKFEKNYRAELKPLTENEVQGCLELVERWEAESPEDEEKEKARTRAAALAIKVALVNLTALKLSGLVAIIDSRVEGFCLGGRLNQETVVVHVELANREITGLHQYLNRECARSIWKEFRYINREQDAGIPGLRRSKLSYQPDHLVKKYDLFSHGKSSEWQILFM